LKNVVSFWEAHEYRTHVLSWKDARLEHLTVCVCLASLSIKSVLLQLLLLELKQLQLLLVLERLEALHFSKQFFSHRHPTLGVSNLQDPVQIGLVLVLRETNLLRSELKLLQLQDFWTELLLVCMPE
jgi:hypothetical protein